MDIEIAEQKVKELGFDPDQIVYSITLGDVLTVIDEDVQLTKERVNDLIRTVEDMDSSEIFEILEAVVN